MKTLKKIKDFINKHFYILLALTVIAVSNWATLSDMIMLFVVAVVCIALELNTINKRSDQKDELDFVKKKFEVVSDNYVDLLGKLTAERQEAFLAGWDSLGKYKDVNEAFIDYVDTKMKGEKDA